MERDTSRVARLVQDWNQVNRATSCRVNARAVQHREMLSHLDRAIQSPASTASELLQLDDEISSLLDGIQDTYDEQTIISIGNAQRFAEIRTRYAELRQQVGQLAGADSVDSGALTRLRTSLLQAQRDEMRLLFDCFWTDTGGGD